MYEMNPVRIEKALEKVGRLTGIVFTRSDETWNKTAGVAVSQVRHVLPEAVATDGHGDATVDYGAVVGLLVEAIKEQQQQIESLRSELDKRKTLSLPKK